MENTRRRSRAVTLGGLAVLLVAGLMLPLMSGTASADTTSPGMSIKASVGAQSNVDPNTTALTVYDGQTITVNVTASSPPAGNAVFGVDARLCKNGLNIAFDAQFDPTAFPNCVLAPLSVVSQDFASVATAPPNTNATITFKPGAGFDAVNNITCGVGNPCALWLKLFVPTTSVPSGLEFVHYNLNYVAPPTAPTVPQTFAATPGNTQVGLSWAAPSSDGGSPIDYYRITGSFPGSPIQTANGSITTATISSLTNFTPYTFNVEAHNAVGYSPVAGPLSSTPTPPAPTGVSGIAGDQSVLVSWVAPTGPVPTGYTVTGVPGGTCTATPPATSCTVTGLTNGTTYTFTVQAAYGANNGPVSAPSAAVTPNGTYVTQIITADRPVGTLDIAEGCFSGGTPNFGLYPQTCNVNLGTGVLNAASTYYVANGTMQTVSVRDLRDTDAGWNVNTQISAFTSGTDTFGGNCLSLTPAFNELSNSATYTQAVTVSGHVLNPADTTATGTAVGGTCTGTGLAGATVMSAAANGGLGRTDLDGALQLNIPVSADAGTYTATLTFTVI